MAEYYVDGINGDDSNSGTSKDQAWKTIAKAMNTLTAGDICHIRPGVYRQSATLIPANSGNDTDGYIEYIGDTKGEIWGEKGDVVITNVNDGGTSTAFNGHLIDFDTNLNHHLKFINLTFVFGNTLGDTNYNLIKNESTGSYDRYNWFIGNKFISGLGQRAYFVRGYIRYTYFIRNTFIGWTYGGGIELAGGPSYVYIENNIFVGLDKGIWHNGGYGGYYYIYNNTFIGCYYGLYECAQSGVEAINNLFIGCYYDSDDPDIPTKSNNKAVGVRAPKISENRLENISIDFLNLNSLNALIDIGNNVTFQGGLFDFYNNPRKLRQGIDIGAVEYNPPAQKETTEVRTGSSALKLPSASFQDIKTSLSAGNYTISVYVKWSGYSGSDKPQLIVKQDKYCGINADQVATATGDGTSWEQLSVNITLTKDAEITIRLYARDTGSSSITYFDDLSIS